MCDKPRTASTYAYSVDNFTSRMRYASSHTTVASLATLTQVIFLFGKRNAEPDVIVERAEIIPLYQPSLYKLG